MSEGESITIAEHTRREAWRVNEMLAQLVNEAMFTDMDSLQIVEALKQIMRNTIPPIQGIISRVLCIIHIATSKAIIEEKYG